MKRSIQAFLTCIGAAVSTLGASASAATVTWNNTSGTIWANGSLWDPALPGTGDDVVFNNVVDSNISQAINLNNDFTINSLTYDLTTQSSTLNQRADNGGNNRTLNLESGQFTRSGNSGAALVIGQNAPASGVMTITTSASGFTFDFAGGSTTRMEAVIAGAGKTFVKTGNGGLRFDGGQANTYTGLTQLNQGTTQLWKTAGVTSIAGDLQLNAVMQLRSNNQIADTSNLEMVGGRIELYASDTLSTLTVSGNTQLRYSSSGAVVHFDDSSGVAWGAGTTLSIFNWVEGTSGLYFGNDALGLTSEQLAQIAIYSDAGSTLIGPAYLTSEGAITTVPEPASMFLLASGLIAVLQSPRRRKNIRSRVAVGA